MSLWQFDPSKTHRHTDSGAHSEFWRLGFHRGKGEHRLRYLMREWKISSSVRNHWCAHFSRPWLQTKWAELSSHIHTHMCTHIQKVRHTIMTTRKKSLQDITSDTEISTMYFPHRARYFRWPNVRILSVNKFIWMDRWMDGHRYIWMVGMMMVISWGFVGLSFWELCH